MKLYFAAFSTVPDLFARLKHPYLLESYLFFKKKDIADYLQKHQYTNASLFLDSGAFTAFTKQAVIDIDAYCDFIKKHKAHLELYAALDVIGDYQKTQENLSYMESKGLKPLPTFHYGSPLSELHRLCKSYDYIALGGLVPLARQKKRLQNWLDTCFSVIKEYWPKKIHGFGVNAYWSWERYPWYSVDATSWQASGRFGEEYVYKKGQPMRENSHMTAFKLNRLSYKQRFLNSVIVLIKSSEHITNLWTARGITFPI